MHIVQDRYGPVGIGLKYMCFAVAKLAHFLYLYSL